MQWFLCLLAQSQDNLQLWLLIYLTPKFETSESKGKITTFAVALLLSSWHKRDACASWGIIYIQKLKIHKPI